MYAQLGNIRFEGLKGFSSFEETYGVNYAQHDRIKGKPRLEAVGDVLDTVSFEMYLHSSFTDPESDIKTLRTSMQNREVLPLVLGTGVVLGNFVIPSLTKTTSFTDASGNLIEATLSVELLECFDENPLNESEKRAKNQAFATNEKNSNVRTVLPVQPSPSMGITRSVMQLDTSGKLIEQRTAAAEANPAASEFHSDKIGFSLTDIEQGVNQIQSQLSGAEDLAELVTSLPAALQAVNTAAQNMKEVLPIADINDFKVFNKQLQAAILQAKTASVPLNNQSIIRRK